MTDRADERAKVDRTKDPEDPNKDVREEYTSYQERDSDRDKPDSEAKREADLQPGTPASEDVDEGDEDQGGEGQGGKGQGRKS